MLEDLRQGGKVFTEEQLAKVHSPIGLDIGADTPEEIALCVTAEVLAVRNHRNGGFLKQRIASLHDRATAGLLVETKVATGTRGDPRPLDEWGH